MIIVKIKGKNINNFINKLSKNNIEVYNIDYISYKEVNIMIKKSDYELLEKIKTIYEIGIIGYKGMPKYKQILKKNTILIISFFASLLMLLFLTNIIFDVEIIYNDEKIRSMLINELRLHNIEEYKFAKSFKEIEKIKKQILEKYNNEIEWLEINRLGTKYEIRLELRKHNNKNNDDKIYNIVAKKDAIIKRIIANSGEKIKNINDYVKKGNIVISGNIALNDETKAIISADGIIYGEVWYQVNVNYPFVYKEEKLTGNNKITYGINFLGKTYNLFDFKPYKNKKIEQIKLITNNFIPFSIVKNKEQELIMIDEINTVDEALSKAVALAKKRIEEDLDDNEYIISSKVLSKKIENSKIECVVFFTVYEDITDYQLVEVKNETSDN